MPINLNYTNKLLFNLVRKLLVGIYDAQNAVCSFIVKASNSLFVELCFVKKLFLTLLCYLNSG